MCLWLINIRISTMGLVLTVTHSHTHSLQSHHTHAQLIYQQSICFSSSYWKCSVWDDELSHANICECISHVCAKHVNTSSFSFAHTLYISIPSLLVTNTRNIDREWKFVISFEFIFNQLQIFLVKTMQILWLNMFNVNEWVLVK